MSVPTQPAKSGSRVRTAEADRAIDVIAARQHGVVARRQLLDAGLSVDVIDHRVRVGRLRQVHRGVYIVGPVVSPRAAEMAAVLACGEGAAVSHRSAAVLWELLQPDAGGAVHVTLPSGDRGRRSGICVHRRGSLGPDEVTHRDGIPLTKPARTLVDLAGAADHRTLERAVAAALNARLVDGAELASALKRHAGRAGSGRLRSMLEQEQSPARTRSEAEERFLSLIRSGQLPDPGVNVTVSGYEVDFFWPVERFVVEVDGFAWHASAGRFEADRRRDAVLASAGVRVMRVTWRQIVKEPAALLVRLAQALARAAVRP